MLNKQKYPAITISEEKFRKSESAKKQLNALRLQWYAFGSTILDDLGLQDLKDIPGAFPSKSAREYNRLGIGIRSLRVSIVFRPEAAATIWTWTVAVWAGWTWTVCTS